MSSFRPRRIIEGEYLQNEIKLYKRHLFPSFCFQSCIVGIVVPDVDVIKCWAQENGIPGTFSVLCNNPEVKQLILDDMLAWGKEGGLKAFEQVSLMVLHKN